MATLNLVNTKNEARVELHDKLQLTGCEVSINTVPANQATPFVHFHGENEEVYLILAGDGKVYLDGTITNVIAGDCFKVNPSEHRCVKAGEQGMKYVCIQAKAGSLAHFTMTDGKIAEGEQVDW